VKKQIRTAIFITGKGTNALNLMQYFQLNEAVKIALIFSTRTNEVIEKASKDYEANYVQVKDKKVEWDNLALTACTENKIDFIVLAGFLKKISSRIIEKYPNRIVNIHPSLLPKFGGKGMYGKHVHDAVIEACEKKSGITIHYVNAEFDEGEMIAQFETELTNNETPDSLAEKIHALEMKFFPEVLKDLLSNKLKITE
jgi:phosphoribosylglycinamide formyltransferase-1